MTRHAKNATNSSCYTYYERRKDAAASGYGSEKLRLHKDSIKGFDCCSLTLQPCANPIITPEGWLYDKEAIIKYILDKKEDYRKKQRAYEAQSSREFKELHKTAEKDLEKQKAEFEKREKNITSERKSTTTSEPSTSSGSSRSTQLPSFWVPNLTPHASTTKLQKPDKTVYCPMSGRPLKLKNFIDVKFSLARLDEAEKSKSLISREERYKCAVTNDVLRNTTPVFVIKTTGDVVTGDCVEKIIKPDMVHPLTGESIRHSDLIELKRGGTGYSSANDSLKAERYRPNIAIS